MELFFNKIFNEELLEIIGKYLPFIIICIYRIILKI